MVVRTDKYVERKERRTSRVVWAVFNKIVFPLLPNKVRIAFLRMFGAKIAESCHVYGSVKIYAPWKLEMGSWVCVGPRVEIYNKDAVSIGSHAVISQDAYICTATHDISSPRMELVMRPVEIGSNAWIAAKATVLPGVDIGEGVVAGACSVVVKDVPSWSVVVGNPAVVVGHRSIA